MMLNERDVVALTEDRPDEGLRIGDVGAVIHCYRDADMFEIEFIDENGERKCVASVPASQILKLNLLSLSA
ncbi:MAG: DUF4926 domain-containing protein [Phycisphaerae bacterium]